MDAYSSLYRILGIDENASTEEIKTAFRKKALVTHPDKNDNSPESQAAFIMIYNAYNVLTDPEKRKEYDSYMRSSSVIRESKKAARGGRTDFATAKEKEESSLETLVGHLNFLLWDIEDFMKRSWVIKVRLINSREREQAPVINWLREYDGKPLYQYLLAILTFIDRWVLDPSGNPDYFLQARKKDLSEYWETIRKIPLRKVPNDHSPYVDVADYFYNIRKRMDKFLKRVRVADLVREIPGCGVRLVDGIFEAQNLAVHYLGCLNRILEGESYEITPFPFTKECFRS